ncbi:DEAD/DEAH box helicase family protein [Candidatus Saccharibacteria bacterium]|nr:DEAD/DEAH box helicase family protein [Candidatus Saccharibacteria bacterium]
MAERTNGKTPMNRRTHGSERRGVFPVPDVSSLTTRRQQSIADKARLRASLTERLKFRTIEQEKIDLGNKELPAYRYKQEMLTNIEAYKAVILGGPTGSGKSTQLPQYLYEAGYDKTYVLVPRRIIADGLGDRIREELAGQLPAEVSSNVVGIVHGERSELHEDNRIVVMTPNTFTKMEKDISARYKDQKVAIISDEIHEANLFTEIATGVAAMAVEEHDNWRLIAASATHNSSSLLSSFQLLNKDGYVPMINIEGRPFNVEMAQQPQLTPMEVYAQIGHTHSKTMIFTSGKGEIKHIIEETIAELDRNEPGTSKNVVFRKLHGELTEFELSHIDDPVPEGSRLAIVSSPAGMSGITIPGVTLVVTDGTINRQELDDDGIGGLVRHYLSQSEITQQIGRAGRDVEGGIGILAKPTTVFDDALRKRGGLVEIPQMAYLDFGSRPEHAPPEIYHSNLGSVVLGVAAGDRQFSIINNYIPHTVASSSIINAEESLSRLGALDEDDRITKTGRQMDQFPVTPELARGLTEMRQGGRTLQHLARSAFIAAAVDVGGLQDFSERRPTTWRSLLRTGVTDDFMTQLELMVAARSALEQEPKQAYDFMTEYNLHPKRIERAMKVARKILNVYKIDQNNIIVSLPLPDEETAIRNDFTAGMIDFVYEAAGKSFRKTLYKNIHSDENDETVTQRLISQRSASAKQKVDLIAGIPRWYEKRVRGGELERFDVIEMTMDVDPLVIGEYARKNRLLHGKLLSSRMDNDRIVEREQMMFGTIEVGQAETSVWREHIPESSQKVLVEWALEHPDTAQKALRRIAQELEWYSNAFPADVIAEMRRSKAPANITTASIESLIRELAKKTRSAAEIDRGLSEYIYSKNVTINRFYDDDARRLLQQRSPQLIEIAPGTEVRVFYESGTAYVTQGSMTRAHLRHVIKHPVVLVDGREVLFQVAKSGGGTERLTAAELLLKAD